MIVTPQTFTSHKPLALTSGAALPGFTLAYETWGTLNNSADNAILVCHGLTHSAHAAGKHAPDDARPGWWDAVIGPGKPLDTDRYFVICSNCIGGCHGSTGPGSTHPDTGTPWGLHFPVVTIGDMVRAQRRLMHHLGITRLHGVMGGCMGGFQVLDWMTRFPDMVERAVIITAALQSSPHTLALWEVVRQAIMSDPEFRGGDYYDGPGPRRGMGLSSIFGMMIWMSKEVMEEKFGRRKTGELRYTLEPEFEIQQFFRRILDNAGGGIDPNTLIYLTRAMDYFDLTEGRNPDELFRESRSRTLLLSYDSDWRYPAAEMESMAEMMRSAGLEVTHTTLSSPFGHGAFHCDAGGAGGEIRKFLGSL